MRCAVNYCGNNNRYSNRSKWRFFHFPREATLLKKWLDFCERDSINPETACICNEHFAPEDFERNMQYELGFTRKNPTKLKPGSYPTSNRPPRKIIRTYSNDSPSRVGQEPTEYTPIHQENANSPVQDGYKVVEECDILVDSLDQSSSSNDAGDLIEESRTTTKPEDHMPLEVETIDPLTPQSNAYDHVDIKALKDDTYEKHLEEEVCSLKREVFFPKADRKKLLEEIKNLRASLQSLQRNKEKLKSTRILNDS